jgi:hypothetical protein
VSTPVVLSPLDRRPRRRPRAKGGVFAFAPTLLRGEHILGLTNLHFEKDRICSACQVGKKVGAHHPHKNIMTTDRPLELLHMDLFDPIAYISIDRSKYCLVIVDDYSRFTWVFFLQEMSHTQETLKGFLRRLKMSSA